MGVRIGYKLWRLRGLLLAVACGACGHNSHWDGQRGYDGRGDYGYDLTTSRHHAGSYWTRAARQYSAPGTPDDPWGPYIREAAVRFRVPERWIREVMKQESGGRQLDSNGAPITSWAGAMGLMQVMPHTWEGLRQRYGLGDDPYQPRDNIFAGTAYIREMADQFGAPGFLAAYNAGPERLNQYLTIGAPLPNETVNYLARIAPRLGSEVAMTGPLAAYAGGGDASVASVPTSDADSALDGGGLVTPDAPTGVLTKAGVTAVRTIARPMVAATMPVTDVQPASLPSGGWAVQVGAFADPAQSQAALDAARARVQDLLGMAAATISPIRSGTLLYRARFLGLSSSQAAMSCGRLSMQNLDCYAVPPGS